MKNITPHQLRAIRDFYADDEIAMDWRLLHTNIEFDDFTKTITIKIDNMDQQEYEWIKDE